MKQKFCIGCGLEVGKKHWRYCGECVCLRCAHRVGYSLLSRYGWQIDTYNRLMKASDQGNFVVFLPCATTMALCWARVREALDVQPQFPAGLRQFMEEMNW